MALVVDDRSQVRWRWLPRLAVQRLRLAQLALLAEHICQAVRASGARELGDGLGFGVGGIGGGGVWRRCSAAEVYGDGVRRRWCPVDNPYRPALERVENVLIYAVRKIFHRWVALDPFR